MMAWLPVVVLAVVQICVRVIGVAGMIWRERVCAEAKCAQMRAASLSGLLLCERQENGAVLIMVPLGLPNRDADGAAGLAGMDAREASGV